MCVYKYSLLSAFSGAPVYACLGLAHQTRWPLQDLVSGEDWVSIFQELFIVYSSSS